MEKTNKGSGVESVVNTLVEKGTVKTSKTLFRKVIDELRTSYARLIENKTVSVNYGNFEITLN